MTGHLEHVSGDRWKVRVYAGRDAAGRPRQRTKSFRARNRREALRQSSAIAAALTGNVKDARERHHTFAGLADEWLALCRSNQLSPSTLVNYERIAKLIAARFGGKRVADLTARDVDRWYADLLAAGKTPANVQSFHRVLRAMLQQAERWEMVDRIVTKTATPPKVKRKRHNIPTSEALTTAIASASHEVQVALHLIASTGCRRGELVGLRWGDVSPGRVRIARSLLDVKGHKAEPKSTKGDRERDVDIDAVTVRILEAWRVEHQRRCEALGAPVSPWMFPDWEHGAVGPQAPSWLSHRWSEVREKHGLTSRLHDIRHWNASALIAAGVPIVEVSKRVGHAQVSTTLNIYGHVMPGDRGRSAEVIAGELEVRSS